MKKKLLLIALPALMALSGCANVSVKPAEQKEPAIELMAEDNLAHEEIFGAAEESAKLIKTNVSKLDAFTSDFVKVGYQIKFAANGEGTADDTISIRFVAAIKNENVDAYWSRGLAQSNGYEGARPDPENHPDLWNFKFSDTSTHQSSVIYTRLTDDGTPIEANSGDYAGYTGFVIYTLRNIPYVQYNDSYLAAYVTIVDKADAGNYIKSKAVAVKIERNAGGTASKHAFSFNSTTTGHFLEGEINGAENALLREDEGDAGSAYWAKYSDVNLLTTDSFGSFYYSYSNTPNECHFQFFGKTAFFGDSSALLQGSSLAEYNAPKADGVYTLCVQNDTGSANHVSTYKIGASQEYTLSNIPDWVEGGVKVFVGYADAKDVWHWALASISGTNGSFTAPNNIDRFLLVRCPTSTTEPNWSATGDDAGRIYNKTPDYHVTVGYYSFGCSSWPGYYPS